MKDYKVKEKYQGLLPFSRNKNMIYCLAVSSAHRFIEEELIEEFGYPNQRFVLRPSGGLYQNKRNR